MRPALAGCTRCLIPEDPGLAGGPEKISLGKQFFWDKRWSSSGTAACVSCHDANHGWADPRQLSINFAGKPMPRHTPIIIDRLFSDRQIRTRLRASLGDTARNDANRTD